MVPVSQDKINYLISALKQLEERERYAPYLQASIRKIRTEIEEAVPHQYYEDGAGI